MAECTTPPNGGAPAHKHEKGCGHTAIDHRGHVDFIADGHLRHDLAAGSSEDCKIEENDDNPTGCSGDFECAAHPDGSICGPGCGHDPIPHADHTDYLVPAARNQFELHCPHDDHCDFHGYVKRAALAPAP